MVTCKILNLPCNASAIRPVSSSEASDNKTLSLYIYLIRKRLVDQLSNKTSHTASYKTDLVLNLRFIPVWWAIIELVSICLYVKPKLMISNAAL